MASGEVVGSIFLVEDELFRVEELMVGAAMDFVDDCGFEIDEDGTMDDKCYEYVNRVLKSHSNYLFFLYFYYVFCVKQ